MKPIRIATTKDGEQIELLPTMCNRHGLVTGDAGSGKTNTVRTIVGKLGSFGVPAIVSGTKDSEHTSPEMAGVSGAADLAVEYARHALWLLTDANESMPPVEDMTSPKLMLFFDEAHLLFQNEELKATDKIEWLLRSVRPRGVGVFFVTSEPTGIPDKVISQLGNRIQHRLGGESDGERRSLRNAVEMLRVPPGTDTEAAIRELAVGEVLISLLDERGMPTYAQRAVVASLNAPAEAAVG